MKKRILSAVILGCLIFQGSTMTLPVLAAEDEETFFEDETETVTEVIEEQTEGSGAEYINGMLVDYDDPDCLKYQQRQEGNAAGDGSVPQTYSSGITTTWGGVTYNHKASVAEGKTILPGVDVSKWEGTINWDKVANAGINFAFIRIGYTGASTGGHNLDPYYKTNMEGAISAGIKVGIYYYSQAITVAEAESEAQYVLDNLGGYHLDLPIIMDYEYYDGGRLTESTPNKSTKTEIVKAFCKKIEANGYTAGLYADKDMLTSSLNASEFDSDYEIWLAQWRTSEPSYTRAYQYWQCGGASVDGISGTSDFDWGYFSNTSTSNSASANTGTDIVKKSNGDWVYQVNGQDDYTYTGFAKNGYGWWYIENGRVTFNKNGVIKGSVNGINAWWYVVGSEVQINFTGLADYKNENGWWYISDGKVTFDIDTVAKNKNGWYYVKGSKVDFSYNGFAQNTNGWWYIENGSVTFNKNSVIKGTVKGTNAWWYVISSEVQTSFTGLADYSNSNGWWYINNGQVTFDVNTVARNKNGWYYVKDSQVDFSYNGYAQNSNGWWYIEMGSVTFKKSSVIKGTVNGVNTWWYVVDSKVQTSFTGLADYKNENGWWYINDGKVTFNIDTVAKNKNGWYYVNGSKVDFEYNGIAQNSNGWWYIKNGTVDFSYNGIITVSGVTYTVHNGEVAK